MKGFLQTSRGLTAVETLFQRYYLRLCDFAERFVHDQDMAEDVVQDVFVMVCEQRNELPEAEQAIKRFLYTSVKNACLNKLRHLRVVNHFSEVHSVDETIPESTLEAIIHAEMLAMLLDALETLPAGCSLILRKGYLEGLKNHEIAAELSISINTVKSQKQRAIALLKERLTPQMASVLLPLLSLFD